MKTNFTFIIPIILIGSVSFGQSGFSVKTKDKSNNKRSHVVSKNINGKTANKTLQNSNTKNTSLSQIKKEADLGIKTKYKQNKKTPNWIAISNLKNRPTPSDKMNQTDLSSGFIEDIKFKMGTSNHSSFSLTKNNSKSSRFIQKYDGLEIYGSEVIVHFNDKGQAESLNGEFHSCETDLDLTASLTEDEALAIVIKNIKKNDIYKDLSIHESTFLQTTGPSIKKIIYPLVGSEEKLVVAYDVSLHSNALDHWYYVLDANTGEVLNKYNQLCSIGTAETAVATDLDGISRSINTYLDGSTYYLADATKPMFDASNETGLIITLDANNTSGENPEYITSNNNTWNNKSAISAHRNAGIAYDYFYNNHDRNSIDGNGGDIYSIVNLTDELGNGLDNAYWNGQAIFYGNGDQVFSPLAGSMDVAGHEMSHGVVQNTANLVYQNESGAINESMADIFGFMMDSTDWLIGEDITSTSYISSGALRNLQDPHNGGTSIFDAGYQPKHVNEQYNGTEDNGGVHINSGIPNHAFYLLATNINSKKNAANIFYRALDQYLTRSSDFIDLRASCIQSAIDLHGSSSSIVEEVRLSFSAVGIEGEDNVIIPSGGELEQNTGDEFILSLDINSANSSTLYRSSNTGSDFVSLTTTSVYNKPSITDDGSLAYFVTNSKNIHAIDLTNSTGPVEYIVDNSGYWDNVAISKDGSKLAAITEYIDTSIYVFDLETNEVVKYKLYNPTFTDGVTSDGPLYADAIEWDYTGENLIYDANNVIETVGGDDIDYWDVGIIKVWDNEQADFGSGEIEKLFSFLPDGVSIGNPSFSKNSNNIVAFDYFDTDLDEYAVLGYNIEENETGIIYENNTLGWPSYNQLDDRVAFTTYFFSINGEIFDTDFIQYIDLNDDKITSQSSPVPMISYSTFGVYYTVGERVILSTEETYPTKKQTNLGVFPNPFTDLITLDTEINEFKIEILDLNGKILLTGENNKNIVTTSLDKGIYFFSFITKNETKTLKLIKE